MSTWKTVLKAHAELVQKMQTDDMLAQEIDNVSDRILASVMNGGKILLFGNGGSAADAQHIAAEFVGKFRFDRAAMNAIALTTNTSVLTAVSNDFDFSNVFSRQVAALIGDSDIAIGISTSGFSKNVLAGLREAKKAGAYTVLLSGQSYASQAADAVLSVPSNDTPRIQEMHILIGHYLAEYVERKRMDSPNKNELATEDD